VLQPENFYLNFAGKTISVFARAVAVENYTNCPRASGVAPDVATPFTILAADLSIMVSSLPGNG
jgi:hypothetical protein